MPISAMPATGLLPDPDDTAHPAVFDARFRHPGHHPLISRSPLGRDDTDRLEAAVQGFDEPTHRAVRGHFAARVDQAAAELLEDDGFAAAVGALPFRRGDRIVALGDSITDDACSWAEILRAVLAATDASVTVVNAGISGDTTTGAIERIDLVAASEPTWVIQMLGTNDARRHGRTESVRMLSLDESLRNFRRLEKLITRDVGARLIRMTPAPLDDERLLAWGAFADQWISWRAAEVAELAAEQAAGGDDVIDLHGAFAGADLGQLLSTDGVHPTVRGQQRILRALVAAAPA